MTRELDVALPDVATLADLRTFVGRAKQIDADGAARLVAHGPVLAVYASALHGGGSPTVLALRVLALAEPSELDVTVPIASLTDRFALADRQLSTKRISSQAVSSPIVLSLPPNEAAGAAWAGMVPGRSGWSLDSVATISDLRRAARAGIEEVAAGTPQIAGAAAVARLRAAVWGRPLLGHQGLPTGMAFAAEAFGFLGSSTDRPDEVFDQNADTDAVSIHRSGPWWRLSATRGHVLARTAPAL
jgi:hypothetical protein